MPFYENQPAIYPLHRLLEEVLSGEVRVPRFQRPGTESTWKPHQRGELLDSIYRAFPVGTILLWSTNENIKTIPVVGGADIPCPSAEGRRMRLVLDGHQRLSTLIAILGSGLEGYRQTKEKDLIPHEVWVFDVSDEGSDEKEGGRFKLLREDERAGAKQVPLSIALDRIKLNEWVRQKKKLTRSEVRRVDGLRDRFREFSIPVATLSAESLDVATETFKRINSSGTPMSDFHMVSALAYTDQFDPQEHFERVRAEFLEPEGWGDFDDADMLRVCAGLVRRLQNDVSQHPAKLEISSLGKSLRDDINLIEQAGASVAAAAAILRKAAGVHGAAALPYSWQLIVLAIELGSRNSLKLRPKEISQCGRWFWLTTYGGVFAGVNSAIVDRAGRALSDMLDGQGADAMLVDISHRVEEPSRFDFRAARARASLLAMARQQDNGDLGGAAHQALAEGTKAVQTLVPKAKRSSWYNLIIELDHDRLRAFREALRRQASNASAQADKELLETISFSGRDAGNVNELLQIRRARLIKKEKAFVEELGLEWREPAHQ